MDKKYIFVTGGVVSGLGKGITAASLGRLLKARGLRVAAQKLDPYINVDPGTMSPFQHGEVYVTEDGAETDLDLGHYERFIDEAPLMLEKAHFSWIVCRELGIDAGPCDIEEWKSMVDRIKEGGKRVTIALVGKYIKLHDAYLSVAEALRHGGYETGRIVDIKWIEAEDITAETEDDILADADGIIVPGGFGDRGIEGMIRAAGYARRNNIPYLGICLGMQIAVIEYARNVLGFDDANSGEFDDGSAHKVIDLMPDQYGDIPKGGTMRLGVYPCKLTPGSLPEKIYGCGSISERHRHRYEFNNEYREQFTEAGMHIAGTSPDGHLVESVVIPGNDFFIGVQYHPEFKSRPNRAHPLFREFVRESGKMGANSRL